MTQHTFSVTEAQRLDPAQRAQVLANPGFGNHFTDHMISIVWTVDEGWGTPEILPYGPISMDPSSSVLHYGQEIFEGLKAYRTDEGALQVFRVEANARRFNDSARRLALPELPVELFVQSVKELVTIDADWVPSGVDTSLYLRPFMFADESFLGIRATKRARFMVIASPAGSYFAGGVKPVQIWLSEQYSRAGQGGTGAAKFGGNYAASLLPQQEGAAQGCAQVLFLESGSNDVIDELGGMNLFLVRSDGNLITPALSGNILAGITRDSLIQLARDRGLNVEERQVTVSEWREGVANGSITEAFACGTAAVITPISALKTADGRNIDFGDDAPGSLTMSLKDELTGIQTGHTRDPHMWVTRVVAAK